MSTNSPGPRRRRIAGERKPTPSPSAAAGGASAPAPRTPVAAPARPPARGQARPAASNRPRAPRRAAPRRLLVGLTVAATVLVLTAAALALFLDGAGWGDWQKVRQQDQVEQALRTAPAAAERAATAILAYDYRKLEADRDAAAALMTPDYREEYLKTFELVMDAAPQRKARVEADVRASGVSVPGADRVEVLLFVNQTTVSTANSGEPQTALNRVVFTMERQGDAWRVDDITSY